MTLRIEAKWRNTWEKSNGPLGRPRTAGLAPFFGPRDIRFKPERKYFQRPIQRKNGSD